MRTTTGKELAFEAGAELLREYGAAVSANDLERWLSLWTESGVQMGPDAPQRVGREEIRSAMEPLFDLNELQMVVAPDESRSAGDWGIVRGQYTVTVSSKTRPERSRRSGKFLSVVEKQNDGSWKLACDCFNYNSPESEAE